jgi:uncharacterized protein
MIMIETPRFFPNGDVNLFGVYHHGESDTPTQGFVFCHPFGEEKLWTHRVFVSFARRLAERGHPVLRFDSMGNGDSGGSFENSSLDSARSDVQAAIHELQKRSGVIKVGLLGLRLGATVASLVAEERADVEPLILWAPIVDGARYMQDLLRINLTTQMSIYKEVRQDREMLVELLKRGETVNVDGYEMALSMYEQVSAVKLAAGRKQYQGPCFVVQVESKRARESAELVQLVASYPSGTLAFAQEEPFWKEIAKFYDFAPNLFDVTQRWMQGLAEQVLRSKLATQP